MEVHWHYPELWLACSRTTRRRTISGCRKYYIPISVINRSGNASRLSKRLAVCPWLNQVWNSRSISCLAINLTGKTSLMRLGIFALVMVGALLVSCHNKTAPVIASRTRFPPPPRGSAKPVVENSPEAIAAGKVLFQTRCNRCHDLKSPEGYTKERWAVILQTMIPRARVYEDQAKQIRSYIMANASK